MKIITTVNGGQLCYIWQKASHPDSCDLVSLLFSPANKSHVSAVSNQEMESPTTSRQLMSAWYIYSSSVRSIFNRHLPEPNLLRSMRRMVSAWQYCRVERKDEWYQHGIVAELKKR